MASGIVWNGTSKESADLTDAVTRNCACEADFEGRPTAKCAAHQMLLTDQRALDGLVFVRRIAERLQAEEWRPKRRRGAADTQRFDQLMSPGAAA